MCMGVSYSSTVTESWECWLSHACSAPCTFNRKLQARVLLTHMFFCNKDLPAVRFSPGSHCPPQTSQSCNFEFGPQRYFGTISLTEVNASRSKSNAGTFFSKLKYLKSHRSETVPLHRMESDFRCDKSSSRSVYCIRVNRVQVLLQGLENRNTHFQPSEQCGGFWAMVYLAAKTPSM